MPGVDDEELVRMLGRYAGGALSRNATLAAIADACPGGMEQPGAEIPFTSRRRWSAVQFGSTSYLLGAPELFPPGALRDRAEREAQKGRRAVAFGLTLIPVAALDTDALPSTGIRPLGLVVFSEHLRPKTQETVEYFQSQGVTLKVLSGDAVDTVAAIAAAAGIESTGPPLDGTHLPEDAGDLQRLALGTSVVGRISPEGKRRMVVALREAGLYVTMIGDGVNDVPP
jgi:magnesium-transporting ATPase (P-type)